MRRIKTISENKEDSGKELDSILSSRTKRNFAILVPILFLIDVIIMLIMKLQGGGDATALIGGTAIFILIIVSITTHKTKPWNRLHLT